MTELTFVERLRAAIQRGGGKAPGERTFYREVGLTRSDLWAAGFASFGDACKAAGAAPNTLQRRYSDDELFRPLALLARQLSRFPPKGALEVQRMQDAAFPSWEAFKSRERRGPEDSLKAALRTWCQGRPDFEDAAALVQATATGQERVRGSKKVVTGHVYLMRYGAGGQVYKIGRTDNIPQRHARLNATATQDLRVVHKIDTDDPVGIEKYWHDRFAAKLVAGKKELFRLAPQDVAAFRSRSYM